VSKGTPIRNIRVPDDIWQRAKARAAAQGTTVSDIIQEALRKYAEGWKDKP
jgi:predicted DNA-binding protein